MPVADDDYKRRLINTLRSGFKTGREAAFAAPKQLPEMMQPNYGLIPIGPLDRMAERQAQEQNRMRLAANLRVAELDFDTIKQNLKDFLQAQS